MTASTIFEQLQANEEQLDALIRERDLAVIEHRPTAFRAVQQQIRDLCRDQSLLQLQINNI